VAVPGALVVLKPALAPDAASAAQYYPANYWYALLKVPSPNEFPGTGPAGNGISPKISSQGQWMHLITTTVVNRATSSATNRWSTFRFSAGGLSFHRLKPMPPRAGNVRPSGGTGFSL